MKKLFIAILVSIVSFAACDKNLVIQPESENGNGGGEEPAKEYSIVGVWECNKYFISFSSDGFVTTYYTQKHIESGTYSREGNTITISCPYFDSSTKVTIRALDDKTLSAQFDYKDHMAGTYEVQQLNFNKSAKTPSQKENALIGKSYTYLKAGTGHITYAFNTYNTIQKSSDKSNIEPYPLTLFYVYLDGVIYYQEFTSGGRTPAIGGWNNDAGTYKIKAEKVTFESDGVIGNLEDVTDSKV